nr:HD domain-containing protein [Treponemataceae bacterium]
MKVAHAQKLLEKYVSGETLLRHCRTVAAVLRHFAEKRGERDAEFWESVGLLHDIDFEQYPEQHCVKARDIFEAEKPNFPAADGGSEITEELVHAVLSHGWQICCDVEPVHPMERILYT